MKQDKKTAAADLAFADHGVGVDSSHRGHCPYGADFGQYGEKTLLAKFAKLQKL